MAVTSMFQAIGSAEVRLAELRLAFADDPQQLHELQSHLEAARRYLDDAANELRELGI